MGTTTVVIGILLKTGILLSVTTSSCEVPLAILLFDSVGIGGIGLSWCSFGTEDW